MRSDGTSRDRTSQAVPGLPDAGALRVLHSADQVRKEESIAVPLRQCKTVTRQSASPWRCLSPPRCTTVQEERRKEVPL
jgi:hypothetical protein